MKKTGTLLLILTVCLTAFSCVFGAGGIFDSGEVTDELHSDIYYMESYEGGTVFFEKNADKKVAPAAFVKLIAAATAIEKWGDLDGTVTVSQESLSQIKYDYGIRKAGFAEGEKVTRRDLINALVVYSANDAASIIAYEIAGSASAFVSQMQTLAEKAGCTATAIKNIHGFDEDGQYTTARDVAKFLKYALKYPAFSEAFSAESVTLPATNKNDERTYKSGNKLFNASISDYYHSSVTGGKYTSTEKAGECVAAVSNMDGYSYLTVVMGGKLMNVDSDSSDENTCFTDTKEMLDWVYDNIRYRVIVSPDQSVCVLPVTAGKGTDKVILVPEKEMSALVPSKATPASVSFEIVEGSLAKKLVAPVQAGTVLGQARVYYAGQELATVNLVASEDISRSAMGYIMSVLTNIFSSGIFLFIIAAAFIASAGYLALVLYGYFTGKNPLKKTKPNQAKKKTAAKRPAQTGKKPPAGKPSPDAAKRKAPGKDPGREPKKQ
ncbi:MAG: D-alanyl-D-alanine carboxypeptidase family protein [Acutalibacteraceae bacterium]